MALPSYKEIVELLKKGATVEAQEQIMALREAALTLQEENLSLRERVRALEDELRLKGKLEFDGVAYYIRAEGVQDLDGPFCQRCYDVEKKLVRLQDWDEDSYACFSCGKNYVRK
jgi:hypothetical protein